jgi:hypothetical protein
MNRITIVATILIALTLSACTTAQEALIESGMTKMSQAEVVSLFEGNTEKWGAEGAAYYAPNGNMQWLWKEEKGTGKWSVNDEGILCLNIEVWYGKDDFCNWEYYRKGDTITSYGFKKRDTNKSTIAKYTEGNSL